MKKILLGLFLLVSPFCFGQKYKVTGINGSGSDGAFGCNGSSYSSYLSNGVEFGSTDINGVSYWNNKPTSLIITTSSETSDGQCNNVVVVCYTNPTVSLNLNECETYDTGSGGCYNGQISFKIEPIINIPTGSPPNTAYCVNGSPLFLNATNGFSSYKWEYSIGSATNFQPFRIIANNNTISIAYSDVSGFGLEYNQSIYFRYTVGNCSQSVNYQQIGPYTFTPPQVSATYTISAPKCFNGTDGSITVDPLSYSRNPESGEAFNFEVHTSASLGPASLVDDNTKLTPGNYFGIVTSTFGCGAPVFTPLTVPSGPPALSATASVTSNYNGQQVSCIGYPDGAITINATGGTGAYSYSIDGGINYSSGANVFSGLGSATYNIVIKDANNCTFTVNPNLTISSPTAVTNSPAKTDNICNGASAGSITITGGGGVGGYQYSKDNGVSYQASNVFSGLPSGNFQVVVKDLNGCTSPVSTINISEPTAISYSSIAKVNPTCSGLPTGSLTINGTSGGTGTFQYSKDGTNFQPGNILTAVPAGTYSITIKDSNNCTAIIPNQTLTDPPAIVVTAMPISVKCFGGNDGIIAVSASNGVGALQYSLNGTIFQPSNVFNTNITSGSYTVTVKDANGCSGFGSVFVSQPSALLATLAPTAPINCNGQTTNLNLTPSGGTEPYTFAWSTGATTEDLTNVLAGSYSVTITDSKSCTTIKSTTLTEPALLTNTITSSTFNGYNITCQGANNGLVNLTPNGGSAPYTFVWSNGSTTEDLAGRGPGTYSVTITDSKSCTSNASITLTEPTAINIALGAITNVTCNGLSTGAVTVSGSGGTSVYEYSKDGTTWQPSPTFTGLIANAYTLSVRDQNNCTTQVSTTITQPAVLSVTVNGIQNASCGNTDGSATSTASGGSGAYTFTWKNSSNQTVGTSAILTGVGGGSYSVTVTDQNNCTSTGTALISSANGAQATINSTSATSCFNTPDGKADITITSGQGPFVITWSNGETGLSATNLLPGNNSVSVKDGNNCTVVFPVNIPSPSAITLGTPLIAIPTCNGDASGSVQVQPLGGTGPYTYLWSTSAITALVQNIKAGTYTVLVTDSKGCKLNGSVTVTDVPVLQVVLQTEQKPSCVGSTDGSLTIVATGGNGGYTYQWAAGTSGAILSNIKAGSYSVTVQDSKSCSVTTTFNLTDPPPFKIDLGPDKTVCEGQGATLSAGVDNAIYVWSSANGFTSTQKTVTLTQPGTYTLKVTSQQGCKAEDSFVLTNSNSLLKSDFLMVREAYEADTVIAIDISWPLPEGVTWTLPTEARVLTQNADYAEMVFDKSGTYPVILQASLAGCKSTYSQDVKILSGKRPRPNGRQDTIVDLIQNFTVYPNPSDGEFTVSVKLSKETSAKLMLINTEGNKVLFEHTENGKDHYEWHVERLGVTVGLYFLVLKVGDQTKVTRLVIH